MRCFGALLTFVFITAVLILIVYVFIWSIATATGNRTAATKARRRPDRTGTPRSGSEARWRG